MELDVTSQFMSETHGNASVYFKQHMMQESGL